MVVSVISSQDLEDTDMQTIGDDPQLLDANITLTPSAIEMIDKLVVERGLTQRYLRIYAQNNGHSTAYGMVFQDSPETEDVVLSSMGDVSCILDPISAEFMRGSVIDFENNEYTSGFRIDNPNELAHSCGCGTSNNGCGCGGGCSC
jgi:iron-sulfur cluster assembly accessory protein